MKYLGEISNPYDMVTKEYVDSHGGGGGLTVDDIYPVGSIYMSVNSTDPGTLFSGTQWERITGQFLLGATDNGASGGNSRADIVAGGTGGEASHTLTTSESGQKAVTTNSGGSTSHYHGINSSAANASFMGMSGTGATSGLGEQNHIPTNGTATNVYPRAAAKTDFIRVVNTAPVDISHTHGITGSSASSAHNNMPPYLAVYIWKRTL